MQQKFVDPQFSTPGYGLTSQRIPPLLQPIRGALIDMYCLPAKRAEALTHAENKDCLVRLYLGKRKESRVSRIAVFSLRNFQLHLNQMEDLQLPVEHYSLAMAEALAVMHWHAKVDARDVEFVLGCRPKGTMGMMGIRPESIEGRAAWELESQVSDVLNFHERILNVWLLDFNQVQDLTMDVEGVTKAVTAFFLNDPYYPRPSDKSLWKHFSDAYLRFASSIVRASKGTLNENLPQLFIEGIEKEYERKHGTAT